MLLFACGMAVMAVPVCATQQWCVLAGDAMARSCTAYVGVRLDTLGSAVWCGPHEA